jgi:hypothetical protein
MAFKSFLLLGGLLAVAGVTVAVARPASACGGLFCSAANPVNQAAERIIFAQQGGATTAVIEIQYKGASDSFSWVLPVPGVPEVGLSSKQALDALQNTTNPVYSVNLDFGSCGQPLPGIGGFADGGAFPGEDGDDGVHVLASGSVGPYDFTVLEIDMEAANPVQLMLDWLEMNGYDVSLLGGDLLGEYAAQGMNFLAVKLNKSSNSGSIRPVMISYQSDRPLIPIRPTQVAANPDMGVMTWVLGESRAIPVNYRGLELNEALIDWFNPNERYNDVVIEAANQAGGHGFVTEHAEPSSVIEGVIWSSFHQNQRDQLEGANIGRLILDSAEVFGGWDGYPDVVRDHVPLRDGVTVDEFLECVSCYFNIGDGYYDFDSGTYVTASPDAGADDPIYTLDEAEFLAALDELVLNPMKATQALFDVAEYSTRFYTTLSADEMNVDPEFDFNPDLEDVSNFHQVTQVRQCGGDSGLVWSIELPSGVVVRGDELGTWPISLDSGLPYNQRILQYSTSGPPEVITDNGAMIGGMVAEMPLDGGPPVSGPTTGNGGTSADSGASDDDVVRNDTYGDSDCGCRIPGRSTQGSGVPAVGLGLLALAALRRRRSN